MLEIDSLTIGRLRDRLKARGERPSLFVADLKAIEQAPRFEVVPPDVLLRFDALCEAMFLMASSDGALEIAEEDVLRGAIRELSEGAVRTVHIRSMMEEAQQRLAREGMPARIRAVAARLKADESEAEAAFVLCAAIAFADSHIADEENDMLNDFAEALGLDEVRANALLDEFAVGSIAPSASPLRHIPSS